jgi:hypothetical protein
MQVWKFGNDLTLVALGGEVVVDYARRLKRELGSDKLWLAGYANDVFASGSTRPHAVAPQRVRRAGARMASGAARQCPAAPPPAARATAPAAPVAGFQREATGSGATK